MLRARLVAVAVLVLMGCGVSFAADPVHQLRVPLGRIVPPVEQSPASTPCSDAAIGGTARYLRVGASGAGTGLNWTDAHAHQDAALAALTRGQTLCVADGVKSGGAPFATFTTATSGTSPITIVKATAADHGTDQGWSDTFGDGVYRFGEACAPSTNYWVFHGATRAANWFDASGANYGLRFSAITGNGAASCPSNAGDNITLQRVDIGFGESQVWADECDASSPCWGIAIAGGNDWTVTESRIHNVNYGIQTTNSARFTLEKTVGGPTWGKEFWRGFSGTVDALIRWNHLLDTCMGIAGQPGSGLTGCTSIIAFFDSGTFDGSLYGGHLIYGNLLGRSTSEEALDHGHESNGCISFLATQNTLIFSNLCYGLETNGSIDFGSGTCVSNCGGNVARNNMWAFLRGGTSSGVVGGTASNNGTQASDIFIKSSTSGPTDPPNFRLTAPSTTSGVSTGSPAGNAADVDGVTRGGDGTWDIGPFEFQSGSPLELLPLANTTAPAARLARFVRAPRVRMDVGR